MHVPLACRVASKLLGIKRMHADSNPRSVENGIYARSGKPKFVCVPRCLRSFPRAAFKTVPVKAKLTMIHSSPLKEDHQTLLFYASLGSRWCDIVGFVSPRIVSQAPFGPLVYLLCHLSWIQHVQDSISAGFIKGWVLNTWTCFGWDWTTIKLDLQRACTVTLK